MKYFTREWYERMQMHGPMLLWEDERSLLECKEFYRSEGRNFEQEEMARFEASLPLLRRYVPEELLELMDGGRLRCCVPPEDKAAPIRKWLQEEEERSLKVGEAYGEHFESVKHRLPPGVKEFLDSYPLHDARIVAALKLEHEPDCLRLMLDCRGAFRFIGWCTAVFTGVKELELPEDPIGLDWLYDEVYVPEPNVFELRALLYSFRERGPVELRIVAEDIRMEDVRPLEGQGNGCFDWDELGWSREGEE